MNQITIVSAYWEQPQVMREWWRVLRSYDQDLVPQVRLVLCDDCSIHHQLVVPADIREKFWTRTFRLTGTQPWKEMVARNLCMRIAKAHGHSWVFLTDPDYLICNREMRKLLTMKLERGVHYHFRARVFHDKEFKAVNQPGNMGVIHVEDFWKGGGYDEGFAGSYGFSDTLMWRNLRMFAGQRQVVTDAIIMDHYPKGRSKSAFSEEMIEDAATTQHKDVKRNRRLFDERLKVLNRKNWDAYRKTLLKPSSFPFQETHG